MSIRSLDALSAFAPGSELWIIADLSSSRWARKIDWYLNFQLAAAEEKSVSTIAPELIEISKRWEFDLPAFEFSGQDLSGPSSDASLAASSPGSAASFESPAHWPLMVASSRLLPNQMTVRVPFDAANLKTETDESPSAEADAARTWVERCHQIWVDLQKPPVRVFLPDGLKPDAIVQFWGPAGQTSERRGQAKGHETRQGLSQKRVQKVAPEIDQMLDSDMIDVVADIETLNA